MADNDDKKVVDDTKTDEAVVEETSTEEAKTEEVTVEPVEEVKTDETVAETPEETPAEEVKAEESKEEPAPVEKPAEASTDAKAIADKPAVEEVAPTPAPTPVKADKPVAELKGALGKLAKEIEGLTVLELSELASYLEEKFGVSSAPMMAMGPSTGSGQVAAGEPAEEKTSFNVVMTDGGANKLGAIKAVRELRQDLGLMEAKKLVETPPQTILENVKKDEAEAAVKKFTDAGAKAEMK